MNLGCGDGGHLFSIHTSHSPTLFQPTQNICNDSKLLYATFSLLCLHLHKYGRCSSRRVRTSVSMCILLVRPISLTCADDVIVNFRSHLCAEASDVKIQEGCAQAVGFVPRTGKRPSTRSLVIGHPTTPARDPAQNEPSSFYLVRRGDGETQVDIKRPANRAAGFRIHFIKALH